MSIEESEIQVEYLPADGDSIRMRILHIPTGLRITGSSKEGVAALKRDLIEELEKRVPLLPKLKRETKVDDWSL